MYSFIVQRVEFKYVIYLKLLFFLLPYFYEKAF